MSPFIQKIFIKCICSLLTTKSSIFRNDLLRCYGLCDVCYIIDNYYKEVMKILVPTDPGRIAIGIPKKNKISW